MASKFSVKKEVGRKEVIRGGEFISDAYGNLVKVGEGTGRAIGGREAIDTGFKAGDVYDPAKIKAEQENDPAKIKAEQEKVSILEAKKEVAESILKQQGRKVSTIITPSGELFLSAEKGGRTSYLNISQSRVEADIPSEARYYPGNIPQAQPKQVYIEPVKERTFSEILSGEEIQLGYIKRGKEETIPKFQATISTTLPTGFEDYFPKVAKGTKKDIFHLFGGRIISLKKEIPASISRAEINISQRVPILANISGKFQKRAEGLERQINKENKNFLDYSKAVVTFPFLAIGKKGSEFISAGAQRPITTIGTSALFIYGGKKFPTATTGVIGSLILKDVKEQSTVRGKAASLVGNVGLGALFYGAGKAYAGASSTLKPFYYRERAVFAPKIRAEVEIIKPTYFTSNIQRIGITRQAENIRASISSLSLKEAGFRDPSQMLYKGEAILRTDTAPTRIVGIREPQIQKIFGISKPTQINVGAGKLIYGGKQYKSATTILDRDIDIILSRDLENILLKTQRGSTLIDVTRIRYNPNYTIKSIQKNQISSSGTPKLLRIDITKGEYYVAGKSKKTRFEVAEKRSTSSSFKEETERGLKYANQKLKGLTRDITLKFTGQFRSIQRQTDIASQYIKRIQTPEFIGIATKTTRIIHTPTVPRQKSDILKFGLQPTIEKGELAQIPTLKSIQHPRVTTQRESRFIAISDISYRKSRVRYEKFFVRLTKGMGKRGTLAQLFQQEKPKSQKFYTQRVRGLSKKSEYFEQINPEFLQKQISKLQIKKAGRLIPTNLFKSFQKSASIPKLAQRELSALKSQATQSQKQIFFIRSHIFQAQRIQQEQQLKINPEFLQKQIPKLQIKQTLRTRITSPLRNPQIIPKSDIPGIPFTFTAPKLFYPKFGKKKTRKETKREYYGVYNPSLIRVYGKKPEFLTGIEVRPIIRKR